MPAVRPLVVLVEDEELIRRLLVRVLESAEYEVLVAANGEQALGLMEDRADELALLLTDLVMPGMSGLELSRAARELQPDLPVLCMSGYSEQTLRDRGGDGDEIAFIEKPFAPGELTDRIAALLRAAAERPGVGEIVELD
jgi:two-component system, cell cycle sensor histidine kinase and response regulator CckA